MPSSTEEFVGILIILSGLGAIVSSASIQPSPRFMPLCPESPFPHVFSDQDNYFQYVICTGRNHQPLIYSCDYGQFFNFATQACEFLEGTRRDQFPPHTKPFIPSADEPVMPILVPAQEEEEPSPPVIPALKPVPGPGETANSGDHPGVYPPDEIPVPRPVPIDDTHKPQSSEDTPVPDVPVQFPVLYPEVHRPYPVRRPTYYPGDPYPMHHAPGPVHRPYPIDDGPMPRPYPVDDPIVSRPYPVRRWPFPIPVDDFPVQWPFPPYPPYPAAPFPSFPSLIPVRRFQTPKGISVREPEPSPGQLDTQFPSHSRPIFEDSELPIRPIRT